MIQSHNFCRAFAVSLYLDHVCFMSPATPVLRCFDEAHTRAFYLDFLGFSLDWEHRFDLEAPLYFPVSTGDCQLHLSPHFGDATPGSAVRIGVDDVRAFAAALRAKDYPHARPGEPELKPWGLHEIVITDPAGNRLTFFSPETVT